MKEDNVSRYALYGEMEAITDPEFFHIEDIRARSMLYEWQIMPHAHPRMFQMLFLQEGSAEVQMDGRATSVEAPCFVTVPGGVVHSFAFRPETVGYVVTVSEALILDARFRRSRELFEPLLAEPLVMQLDAADDSFDIVWPALNQMAREYSRPDVGRSSVFDWLLRVVLMAIRRHIARPAEAAAAKGYDRQVFARFSQMVEDHYMEHWPVDRYALELAMTPARLNRLCRHFAEKKALDIAHDRLVLEARRSLIYSSLTVAVIAHNLGFQDAAYFCRFFKRKAGMTPSQFREGWQSGRGVA